MKTEYQVRFFNMSNSTDWITDIDRLRENYNMPSSTLWRRESETPEDAAVRRMAALEKWSAEIEDSRFKGSNETLSQFADRLSPPPPTTECQVDWQTLEPIKEVPVWQLPDSLTWIAGVDAGQWASEGIPPSFYRLVQGKAAIGHTRDTALRNLAELRGKANA